VPVDEQLEERPAAPPHLNQRGDVVVVSTQVVCLLITLPPESKLSPLDSTYFGWVRVYMAWTGEAPP
jgi:hypothetical protein